MNIVHMVLLSTTQNSNVTAEIGRRYGVGRGRCYCLSGKTDAGPEIQGMLDASESVAVIGRGGNTYASKRACILGRYTFCF